MSNAENKYRIYGFSDTDTQFSQELVGEYVEANPLENAFNAQELANQEPRSTEALIQHLYRTVHQEINQKAIELQSPRLAIEKTVKELREAEVPEIIIAYVLQFVLEGLIYDQNHSFTPNDSEIDYMKSLDTTNQKLLDAHFPPQN